MNIVEIRWRVDEQKKKINYWFVDYFQRTRRSTIDCFITNSLCQLTLISTNEKIDCWIVFWRCFNLYVICTQFTNTTTRDLSTKEFAFRKNVVCCFIHKYNDSWFFNKRIWDVNLSWKFINCFIVFKERIFDRLFLSSRIFDRFKNLFHLFAYRRQTIYLNQKVWRNVN